MSKRRNTKTRPARARRPARRPGRRRAPAPVPARLPKPADASSGLAPGMHPINTYLAVANVGATRDLLGGAVGFTRGGVLPHADGQIRYAEMRHGESVVMLIRKGDTVTATGGAAALYTYVNDVDAAATEARQGGAGVSESEDMPFT